MMGLLLILVVLAALYAVAAYFTHPPCDEYMRQRKKYRETDL